jgi:hypothetical protein
VNLSSISNGLTGTQLIQNCPILGESFPRQEDRKHPAAIGIDLWTPARRKNAAEMW